MSDSPEPAVTTESARGISREAGPFFSVGDKIAFAIASIVAFAGYWYTLAPSVTLVRSSFRIGSAFPNSGRKSRMVP